MTFCPGEYHFTLAGNSMRSSIEASSSISLKRIIDACTGLMLRVWLLKYEIASTMDMQHRLQLVTSDYPIVCPVEAELYKLL